MTPADERQAAPVSDAEVAALVERARLTEDWLRAETPRSDFAYALDADTVRDLAAALERTSAALAAERRRAERVRNMRCDRTPEEMFLEPPFTPRAQGYAAGINEGIRCAQAALDAQEPGS
jgi:hypothetical protein